MQFQQTYFLDALSFDRLSTAAWWVVKLIVYRREILDSASKTISNKLSAVSLPELQICSPAFSHNHDLLHSDSKWCSYLHSWCKLNAAGKLRPFVESRPDSAANEVEISLVCNKKISNALKAWRITLFRVWLLVTKHAVLIHIKRRLARCFK